MPLQSLKAKHDLFYSPCRPGWPQVCVYLCVYVRLTHSVPHPSYWLPRSVNLTVRVSEVCPFYLLMVPQIMRRSSISPQPARNYRAVIPLKWSANRAESFPQRSAGLVLDQCSAFGWDHESVGWRNLLSEQVLCVVRKVGVLKRVNNGALSLYLLNWMAKLLLTCFSGFSSFCFDCVCWQS